MNGEKSLPPELLDGLHEAIALGLAGPGKALSLLLQSANQDLRGQVTALLTPVDDDRLQFFQSTDESFVAEDFPAVPIGSSIAGFVFLSGQSMALDDAQQSSRFYAEIDERSGFTTKEYLATPVILGTSILGVLTIANRSETVENPMFSSDELRLADRYAHLCAQLLDHDNQVRRLAKAASNSVAGIFAGFEATNNGAANQFGGDFSSQDGDLRAQISDALANLGPHDLELLRDLARRLGDLSSQDPS